MWQILLTTFVLVYLLTALILSLIEITTENTPIQKLLKEFLTLLKVNESTPKTVTGKNYVNCQFRTIEFVNGNYITRRCDASRALNNHCQKHQELCSLSNDLYHLFEEHGVCALTKGSCDVYLPVAYLLRITHTFMFFNGGMDSGHFNHAR